MLRWPAAVLACGVCWGGLLLLVAGEFRLSSAAAQPTQLPTPKPWLQHKALEKGLQRPLVAAWERTELQTILHGLSQQERVPLIFDRRIDPSRIIEYSATGIPLETVYLRIAELSGAELRRTQHSLYFGPPAAAQRWRTLLTLRSNDWKTWVDLAPASMRSARQAVTAVTWPELIEPRAFITDWLTQRDLELTNPDLIPHDLWRAGEWAPMPPAHVLTSWLIQFDLTFTLEPSTSRVTLIPIPEDLAIERQHTLSRQQQQQIPQKIRQQKWQSLRFETRGEQLIARGVLEELELLDKMLAGTAVPPKQALAPAETPLSQRKITFRTQAAPLPAVLEKLSQTGLQFETEALSDAGVDLEHLLVTIDVQQVSMADFLTQLFESLDLEYDSDGLVITVRPRSAK